MSNIIDFPRPSMTPDDSHLLDWCVTAKTECADPEEQAAREELLFKAMLFLAARYPVLREAFEAETGA